MSLKRTALEPGKPLQRKSRMRASAAPTNRAGQESLRGRNPDTPRRKPLKRRGPTMTKIRRAAKGEECTLRFPGVCNYDIKTSVWCHSNRLEHGKGMGLKAHDEHGCIGCSACHAFLDGGYVAAGWQRVIVEQVFDIAEAISREVLRAKGVLPA
jgi:hypothetical protein